MKSLPRKSTYISRDDALIKLQRYCVYQDRCHQEVRSKLLDLGVYGDTLEEIIAELITDNFLNEERFARSYVRGKFRMRQWGRRRILQELNRRQISDYCIRKGFEEIEEAEYLDTLREVLTKRLAYSKPEPDTFKRNAKLAKYTINRGYEPDLVWKMIKSLDEEDTA